jgi:hypothetical protein
MLLLLFLKRDTILLCVSSVFIFCFREAGIDPASAGDDGGRESSRLRDELVRFCSLARTLSNFFSCHEASFRSKGLDVQKRRRMTYGLYDHLDVCSLP